MECQLNDSFYRRVVFPEELDLRMRNPANLLKGRGAKRGRPKKTAVRPPVPATKIPTTLEEEHEDTKVCIHVYEKQEIQIFDIKHRKNQIDRFFVFYRMIVKKL